MSCFSCTRKYYQLTVLPGRGGYHRSTSYSDDHAGESRSGGFPYYSRGGGVAGSGGGGGDHWTSEGAGGGRGGGGGGGSGAYTPTGPPGGGGSRASRDGNWRNPSTPQTDETPTTPDWGSHWHPPPSPASTYVQYVNMCMCIVPV